VHAAGCGRPGPQHAAKGLLTSKYAKSRQFTASDDERSRFPQFRGEAFATYVEAADTLNAVAGDVGLTLVQLAVAWALRQPVVASVLVGAKAPGQIEDYLPTVQVSLDDETLSRIQSILSRVLQISDHTRNE
jgi:aryl-alcohol dehydrogenase-like predicted oxidoreductase